MGLCFENVKLPRDNFTLDIDVDIGCDVTGVFGSSGAGKTSLLHLAAGLERPCSGKILFNGRTLVDADAGIWTPPHKRKIGMVFQEARLFPHLSVKDNLLFGQRFRPENAPDELFNEIVDMLEISGLLNSRPRRISGGEAQRVALGRALLSSPELLLLDEPFSAVDAALRKNILPFLWRIRSRLHIPMLIISHDLPDLLQLTSVLLLINKGKVTGHGKIEDLVFKENLFSLVKASGMVSVLDLIVTGREGRDTLVLKDKTGDSLFYAVCREGEVSEKTEIKASIAPEDIILSKKPVYDTSARNVIAGKVSRILDSPGQSLCQIDIGGSNCILAELTKGSFNQINPKPGEQLYCIFKATALDLTFLGK